MRDRIPHTHERQILIRVVRIDLLHRAGDGTARDALSTGRGFRSAVGLGVGGGFSVELREEGDHSIGVVGNVEGVHAHLVHEEDGVSSFVEYVVNEGTEGRAVYSVLGGGGAECSRGYCGYDGFGFFFDA